MSIPQGLICSKKVAISAMTIISIGCMPRLLIEEIVAEVTSNSDFQREVEEHASDAVRGMDFSISVI